MRKVALSLLAVFLVVGCAAASASPSASTTLPTPTPLASAASKSPATASPSPATQAPSVDPTAWVHVTGTETVQIVEGPTETAGALHVRSNTVDTMSDPRVSGTGTVIETITGDVSAGIGLNQSTYSLKNAGGTWEGQCAGAEWNSGNGAEIYCWMLGGGGYAGLTYFFVLSEPTPGDLVLDGIIYPGSPPTL